MKAIEYSFRDFTKILRNNGYELLRCRGDHFVYNKDSHKVVVNRKLNMMVARRLIKENSLVIER
jgi:predicted RNA binding protein YcfA (HicA-like mRNA interferase family)